jgi:hypothetical protein
LVIFKPYLVSWAAGYFLNEVLSGLASWQKDAALYRTEAIGRNLELPGWVLKGEGARGETLTEADFLSHENFKIALHKWHGRILSVRRRLPLERRGVTDNLLPV